MTRKLGQATTNNDKCHRKEEKYAKGAGVIYMEQSSALVRSLMYFCAVSKAGEGYLGCTLRIRINGLTGTRETNSRPNHR